MVEWEKNYKVEIKVSITINYIKTNDLSILSEFDNLVKFLSEQEVEIYQSYKVEFKKVEFLLGRVLLKKIIGELLNVEPSSIVFKKSKYGKLFLDNSMFKDKPIYFNLSHSNGLLVCVIGLDEVGVDVERICPVDFKIMKHIFRMEEIDYVLEAKTLFEKESRFFYIWTRKEAFLKAIGMGFYKDPLSFQVPIKEDKTKNEYNYYTFNLYSEYKVSVVVRNNNSTPIQFIFQEINICKDGNLDFSIMECQHKSIF